MKKYHLFLCLFIAFTSINAQDKTLTLEDATLGYWKGLYPEQLQSLQWSQDNNTYIYIQNNELIYGDAESNQQSSIYSLENLQKAYPQLKRFPSIKNVTSSGFDFHMDGMNSFNTKTSEKYRISTDENGENQDYSRKAKAIAYTLDNNLYIATADNPKITVTNFDDKNIVSGQAIARSEYGISKGTFWSPNGNYLAFYQKDETNVKEYPLVDVTTYPATATPIKYPMAGQGSEIPAVGVYNLKTQKTIYLDIDGTDNHYVTNLSWTPDEKYIIVAEINRQTTKYDLNLYDIATGKKVRTILTEENNIWVEPEHDAVFIPKSNTDFIWLSEKDGFKNLYLYNISGKFKKQLTQFT
ncbi:MAG: DPP IV N-terminal domain-containing protein, partial [Weeksellaceae bacterium]